MGSEQALAPQETLRLSSLGQYLMLLHRTTGKGSDWWCKSWNVGLIQCNYGPNEHGKKNDHLPLHCALAVRTNLTPLSSFPKFQAPISETAGAVVKQDKAHLALLPVFHVDAVCMLCSCALLLLLNTISFLSGKSEVWSVKVLEVACERCKTQVLCIGCGGKALLVEIWLFVLTCDIYIGIRMQALLLLGAVTEHCSVKAPDTSVGLDKVWLYILLRYMVENRLKDLQLHAKLFWVVCGQ